MVMEWMELEEWSLKSEASLLPEMGETCQHFLFFSDVRLCRFGSPARLHRYVKRR
jgi:hypothetical protein